MEVDSSSPAVSEPPPALRYRQRLEKSSGGDAVLMEWSPTMDLLAVALADHSVGHLFFAECAFLQAQPPLSLLGCFEPSVMATCLDGWSEQCSRHSHGMETRWKR